VNAMPCHERLAPVLCPGAWKATRAYVASWLAGPVHYSADTLGSAHGFSGSPGHPNRASENGTSKAWPRAKLCSPLNGFGMSAATKY
jgi:hypothetical protein